MSEAQRLAEWLDIFSHQTMHPLPITKAAAELRRLDEELTICVQLKRGYRDLYAQAMTECEQLRQALAAHEDSLREKAAKPAPVAGLHFRKKPVVIEAMQWDGSWDSLEAIKAKFPAMEVCATTLHPPSKKVYSWSVRTLEGSHQVSVGDWIIKGVKGEFYPCKPDIFAMTYDPAAAPVPEAAKPAEPFIQRYSANKEGFMTMDKGPKGGWVKYEDHRSVLARACAAPVAVASPLPITMILDMMPSEIPTRYDRPLEAFARAVESAHGIKEQQHE